MTVRFHVALFASALSLATALVVAQQPTFDAATIKPAAAPTAPIRFTSVVWQPGGRMAANGLTLRELIRSAYVDDGIQVPAQIMDGPDWVDVDRFDIVAKEATPIDGNTDAAKTTRATLLRALLADRFKLRVHADTRVMPVFDLVFVDANAAANPRFKPSTCSGFGSSRVPDAPPVCRPSRLVKMDPNAGITMGFEGMTMRAWAASLSSDPAIDRPIRDRTGLTGTYDFELTRPVPAGPPNPASPPTDSGILTALREQLGVRLDSRRDDVPVIVIDHAERPVFD
jgi:uncharacterized protein (TIGR03435 family)